MIYILPIRFRETGFPLRPRTKKLLGDVANFGFRNSIQIDEFTPRTFLPSFDILKPELVDDVSLTDRLVRRILDVGADGGRILIDVGGPNYQEALPRKCLQALAAFLFDPKMHGTSFYFSFPTDANSDERYFASLRSAIFAKGHGLVGGRDGRYALPGSQALTPSDGYSHRIRRWYDMARNDAARLRRLIIRHLGLFEIGNGEKAYTVFDGSRCVGEISSLIIEFIDTKYDYEHKIDVLVDDKKSTWLRKAANNAAAALDEVAKFHFTSENTNISDLDIDLVLMSVVRTGRTAQEIMSALNINKEIESDADYWALISVCDRENYIDHAGRHTRLLTDESGVTLSVTAEYGYSTEIEALLESFWSGVDAQPRKISEIDFGEPFTSDEAWSIIVDVGLEPEPYHPGYRGKLPWVPNASRLVERHGANIAARVSHHIAQLDHVAGTGLANVVFLYPKEENATILVEYVSALAANNSLGISRDLIDKAQATERREEFEQKLDSEKLVKEWNSLNGYIEEITLGSALYGQSELSFVMMDEFVGTGGTLKNLRKVARYLGWSIKTVVTPFSLAERGGSEKAADFSLYSFEARA